MPTQFNTIVGWSVERSNIVEQYNKRFKWGDDELFDIGKCFSVLCDIIRNSGCKVIDFSLVRQEDRNTKGVFILTIYDDIRKPTKQEIDTILNKFPPIFETIKKDLGMIGYPGVYLKEP